MRAQLLFVLALACAGVKGQDNATLERNGWEPLPDSLFLIWKLTDDQIARIRVIEEDYNGERATLMSEKALSSTDRDARLRTMAVARRKEIQGVLEAEHFKDWQARTKAH